MRRKYRTTKANIGLAAASTIVLVACLALIRVQGRITDKQLLRSMIPQQAAAILMCGEARVIDPEIQALCGQIKLSQRAGTDQMRAKLNALEE